MRHETCCSTLIGCFKAAVARVILRHALWRWLNRASERLKLLRSMKCIP